jgi:hypothetical protein
MIGLIAMRVSRLFEVRKRGESHRKRANPFPAFLDDSVKGFQDRLDLVQIVPL